MKTHAFVRENAPRATLYGQIYSQDGQFVEVTGNSIALFSFTVNAEDTNESKEDTSTVIPHTPCPEFSKFLYFLFAPTLIYRDSYPRTSSVRWQYVISQLVQFATTSLFAHYLFYRFCLPVFRHFNSEHVTLKIFVLSILNCTLPGALLLFCSKLIWLIPRRERFSQNTIFSFSILRVSSLLAECFRWNASIRWPTILQRM